MHRSLHPPLQLTRFHPVTVAARRQGYNLFTALVRVFPTSAVEKITSFPDCVENALSEFSAMSARKSKVFGLVGESDARRSGTMRSARQRAENRTQRKPAEAWCLVI